SDFHKKTVLPTRKSGARPTLQVNHPTNAMEYTISKGKKQGKKPVFLSFSRFFPFRTGETAANNPKTVSRRQIVGNGRAWNHMKTAVPEVLPMSRTIQ
ncbi:MAG: hypothetical protein J6P31_01690, partial [Oscillospiraceae bacterium]|nr:hypothetical protein [Oscillospiraceae bacterium]